MFQCLVYFIEHNNKGLSVAYSDISVLDFNIRNISFETLSVNCDIVYRFHSNI
jgi:hypothetical protein